MTNAPSQAAYRVQILSQPHTGVRLMWRKPLVGVRRFSGARCFFHPVSNGAQLKRNFRFAVSRSVYWMAGKWNDHTGQQSQLFVLPSGLRRLRSRLQSGASVAGISAWLLSEWPDSNRSKYDFSPF